MAVIPRAGSSAAGVAFALQAANAGGDSFRTNGVERFHAKNPTGAGITITFNSPNPCNFGLVGGGHSWQVILAAAAEVLIGPFPPAQFADASGNVQVTYSAAGLTVAVE
jgi:hypothetical protein